MTPSIYVTWKSRVYSISAWEHERGKQDREREREKELKVIVEERDDGGTSHVLDIGDYKPREDNSLNTMSTTENFLWD